VVSVVYVVSTAFFTTKDTVMEMEQWSGRVIGCAIEVRRYPGPGLLESTYESCLTHELLHSGVAFKRQWALRVEYKGVRLDCGHRIDFLVGDAIVLEVRNAKR
jgi:GxxExxY protein